MTLKDKLLDKLVSTILQEESVSTSTEGTNKIDNHLLNKKVIIRTYSAGVHYGTLIEKSESEVILKDSRRLWEWHTVNKGISLSEVAKYGLKDCSRVCTTLDLLWLVAIEIIPCTETAIKNIEAQNEYTA